MQVVPCYLEPEVRRSMGKVLDREVVKILAGELYVTADDTIITTVLGSCVSVCIHDRVNGMGGMNHYMLPYNTLTKPAGEGSLRYGDHAISRLIASLLERGSKREHLEAKVFGAGKVISGNTDIGRRNAQFAMDFLAEQKISVTASDLGDVFPRKVYFAPRTGQVFIRRLPNES